MKLVFSVLLSTVVSVATAQQQIDGIAGVVGGHVVLESDIYIQMEQMKLQGYPIVEGSRCELFENFMFQKLLLQQAELDSVEVSDKEVEDEINRRLQYHLSRLGGSEAEFEKNYGSIVEFKQMEMPIIREELLVRQMRSQITGDIKITPSEVRQYFAKMPGDSLPVIPANYEIAEIAIKPQMNQFERERVMKEMQRVRNDIVVGGRDFGTMAYLFSEDGSKANNGDLGYISRDQVVAEFAAVAFRMKINEVSEVFETEFGFHILQVLEKKGQLLKVRHILKKPKMYNFDLGIAKAKADSIYKVLQEGNSTFGEMASKYSSDQNSKGNGGILMNPKTGDAKFMAEDLDPEIAAKVSTLKEGMFTVPEMAMDYGGGSSYKIYKLVAYTEAHQANLNDDFEQIKNAALQDKQQEAMLKWVQKRLDGTYSRVSANYQSCEQSERWLTKK
jgi:peptidyl-prolyl cis-trans isomerase SurA